MKNITQYLSRKIKFIGFVLILLVLVGDFIRNWPVRFIETIVNSALDGDMNTILMFGGLYLIFHLFGALTKSLSNYLSAYLQTDIGISIQNKLYSKLLRVSLISLQGKNSIEITNSLIEDSEFISNNLIAPLVKLFSAIVSFVIALVIMLNISWQLTLITLPCGLVISLTARAISKKSEKNISEKRTKSSYLWKTFAEGIKGVMPIRLYRYDKKYKEIIFTANEEIKKVTLIQRKLEDMSFFFVSTLFMFTIGIIMISSAIFVVRGTMTIGSLTAVMMYNHMLVDPLIDVLDIQQNLIKLKVSLRRVNSLFSLPDDKNVDKEVVKVDEVVLKNLAFTYDGSEHVFNKINMELTAPLNLCIMGESGAGKTTLANLIASLHTPTDGEILYFCCNKKMNGVPNISYLIQDGYLFDKSIVENIKIANPLINEEKINNLIELCCLKDVLEVHKDNPIGENGNHLSGGERKRVRIAQMLANEAADIYIFDELTSSLDEYTAKKITKNIFDLGLNKICIFIEHDKKMTKFMDKTIIIENGEIK